MRQRLDGSLAALPWRAFLWSDLDAERTHQLQEGKVVAQFWTGRAPVEVPNGLIRDWIGAAFIPGTNVEHTLRFVQDYANHKNIYVPEVIASKLISHHGNDFQIYLRLLKKEIITVVFDTDHEVHYQSLNRQRWTCRSRTTRIAEVQGVGKPKARRARCVCALSIQRLDQRGASSTTAHR